MVYNPSTQELETKKDVEVGLSDSRVGDWFSPAILFVSVLETQPRSLYTLGKYSTTELYPSPVVWKG